MAETDSSAMSVNEDWLYAGGGGGGGHAINAIHGAKNGNNLEIIKQFLRLEIERRAPVSNSFGSLAFINSTVYLRTCSKCVGLLNSSRALCKVRGNS